MVKATFPDRTHTRALVIGSGIAGCTTALELAAAGVLVTLVTAAGEVEDTNTWLAQGGIAYRTAHGAGADDPEAFVADIMTAGWKVNHVKAVRHLTQHGPKVVERLLLDEYPVPFAREGDHWALTREGGHSGKRILHCADYTGKAIMETLAAAVQASEHIHVLYGHTAVDLLTTHHHAKHPDYRYSLTNQCVGAYVLDNERGVVHTVLADFTVLATGGIGQIYLHTTNTKASIGSGLAMSYRAGARIINSEYVQFHPTALFSPSRNPSKRRFLISEAVRGEGATLINADGDPFMEHYDPRKDLAPRDIVTRAISEEMLKTDAPCVYLDAANHIRMDIRKRFPTIHAQCAKIGIDMESDPIPVVPAAHYFCGGIHTDLRGRTTLERLYAVGECACTGLHGANRLASTSLLEGVVYGAKAAEDILGRLARRSVLTAKLDDAISDWQSPGDNENEDPALISQDWATIRNTMWNYVGITRTTSRLQRAHTDMRKLNKHLHDFYRETPISQPLVDLFHGCQTAYIVTIAALRNRVSRGCHHRVD